MAKFATGQLDGSRYLNELGKGIAVAVIGGTASRIGGGKFENGATTAAFGYLFNHLVSVGGSVKFPFIGGAKGAIGISYENGEWDAGVIIDSDIPVVQAGKLIGKAAIEVSYNTGDFRSNHAEQSLAVQGAVPGVGFTHQYDPSSKIITGAGITFSPWQLGGSVGGQQTRTISIRYDIVPRVQLFIDNMKNWLK